MQAARCRRTHLVPPALVGSRVDPDGEHILLAEEHAAVRAELEAEARVAGAVVAEVLAVQPEVGAPEHALELQPYSLVGEGRVQSEALPIPGDVLGAEAVVPLGLVEGRRLDDVIVRDVELAPVAQRRRCENAAEREEFFARGCVLTRPSRRT